MYIKTCLFLLFFGTGSYAKQRIVNDKQECEAMLHPAQQIKNDPATLSKESEQLWNEMFDGLNDDQENLVLAKANTLAQRIESGTFEFNNTEAAARDQFVEMIFSYQPACPLEEVPAYDHFLKVVTYHESNSTSHPIHRRLMKQSITLGATVAALQVILTIWGSISMVSGFLSRVSRRTDADVRNSLVPGFVWAILRSRVFTVLIDRFEQFTGGMSSIKSKVVLVFMVLELIQAIGGFDAIKQVFVNIGKLPFFEMLGEKIRSTKFYTHFWFPVWNWTKTAFIRTKEYLGNITGKPKRPSKPGYLPDTIDYGSLDENVVNTRLYDVPEDVMLVLTHDQIKTIIAHRMRSGRDFDFDDENWRDNDNDDDDPEGADEGTLPRRGRNGQPLRPGMRPGMGFPRGMPRDMPHSSGMRYNIWQGRPMRGRSKPKRPEPYDFNEESKPVDIAESQSEDIDSSSGYEILGSAKKNVDSIAPPEVEEKE